MVSSYLEKPCPQFLIGFILITCYVPSIIGSSIPTGWLFLIIVSPICLFTITIRVTFLNWLGALFIFYCFISLLWTPNLYISIFYLIKIVSLACVFCIGSGLKDIRYFIIGLAVGLLPSDILAFIKYFNETDYVFALKDGFAGLFVNPNIYCEVSVSILLALIAFKLWIYIPFTLPGLVLVHSRGAILGLICGFLIYLFKKNRTSFYVFSVIIFTIGTLYYIDRLQISSINERFELWADTFRGLKVFGNGIGTFEILYPYYAVYLDTSIARPRYAHNDLLNILFETGIGIIPFLIMLFYIYKVKTDETIILIGIGIMSLFSFPLNISVTAFIWFLVAGYVSRNINTIWDNGNSRGSYLFRGYTKTGI